MSDKVISQVSNRIDSLLNQGLRISVANKDTFYLYSTDKKLIGSLMLYKDDKRKPEYSIMLDGLRGTKVFSQSNDVYKKLYNYVNRKYNFESSLDIDKTPFDVQDMEKMWHDMHASKSADKEQKFLETFIHTLIARRCPVDYFQRVFYCFEKPEKSNTKKRFDKRFKVLNVEDKLVEYKTPRTNQWFMTGDKCPGHFIPMDSEARKIFDKVKSALQNQK